MGTEYNLHIVATDIEDFKKQIKAAYEALFPAIGQWRKEQPKAEKPKLSDTSQKVETQRRKEGEGRRKWPSL